VARCLGYAFIQLPSRTRRRRRTLCLAPVSAGCTTIVASCDPGQRYPCTVHSTPPPTTAQLRNVAEATDEGCDNRVEEDEGDGGGASEPSSTGELDRVVV
jgi:hypothetical protein